MFVLGALIVAGLANPAAASLVLYKNGSATNGVWYWNSQSYYLTTTGGKIETGYDMPYGSSVTLQTWQFIQSQSTLIYSGTGGAPGLDAYHPAASSSKSRCAFNFIGNTAWNLKCYRRY